MATNIIPFPRLFVTPKARAERRDTEAQRRATYAEIGTPYSYGGTGFAMFMAVADDLVPKTRSDMIACLQLRSVEALARRLGDDAIEKARTMRGRLAASMT